MPDTVLNVSVVKGHSLTLFKTFLALLYLPRLSFTTSTRSRKKHLLHIARLNDTNRPVLDLLNAYFLQQEKEERTRNYYVVLSIPSSHVFAVATSISPGKLPSTAEGNSVLKSFDQKKEAAAKN